MELVIPVSNEYIELTSTAPTVIIPGEKLAVRLSITTLQQCELIDFSWKTPPVIDSEPEEYENLFPVEAEEGRDISFEIVFPASSDNQGFGDIEFSLKYRTPDGEEISLDWSAWISVFNPAEPNDRQVLDDELRQRLIDVVNAKTQNGRLRKNTGF